MNELDVVQIGSQALFMAAKLSAPILIVSLAVGVIVSLFQTVFQMQDQTIAMVPKLAAGALVIGLTSSWMLRELVAFTQGLLHSIPSLVG